MPNRIVREGILDSRAVNALSLEGEVFYRRLMSVVDDNGRFVADPDVLRARCFPLQIERWPVDRVSRALAEVSNVAQDDGFPLVLVYVVGTKHYLEIHNFGQRLRIMKSKYPAPTVRQKLDERQTGDGGARTDDGHPRADVSTPLTDDSHMSADGGQMTDICPPEVESESEVEENPCAATAAPEQGELIVLEPAETPFGKKWFDAEHERFYYKAFWNRKGVQASRKAYESRVRALVREGMSHENAARFLYDQAVADKARFEGTRDWDYRQRLHPSTWLNQGLWTDEVSVCQPVAPVVGTQYTQWDPTQEGVNG